MGRFRLLRLGLAGMSLALLVGALAPAVMGYTHPTLWVEFAVLAVWTIGASTGWPTLQGLLSREASGDLPRIVGIYNLIWAGASGVAFLTAGAMFDSSNIGTTFLLPAAIHAVELLLLRRVEKRAGFAHPAAAPEVGDEAAPAPNPRDTAGPGPFCALPGSPIPSPMWPCTASCRSFRNSRIASA